jgi:N-carbamoylputrescine amidase
MAVDGAEIIFMPHASPRGLPADKLSSWMRHLPARAFDNGAFIVACNQVGDNGDGLIFPGVALVFGPDGKVLAQATGQTEDMLVIKLQCAQLKSLRSHSMAYFLPHRRVDLYGKI